ncbi:MAG: class I tRNA ligase family protein, partial [Cetobacterium sp.]
SRFFTKVLRDMGLLSTNEPFKRLLTQGMVLGPSYYSSTENRFVYPEEVELKGTGAILKTTGEEVQVKIEKMSKSKNNGVDPEIMINKYGADTTRLFIMFAAPPERELEWNENGLAGAARFLNKIWRLVFENKEYLIDSTAIDYTKLSKEDKGLVRKLHQTIKKVTESIEADYHFNTSIASTMELLNEMQDYRNEILGSSNETSESKKIFREAMVNVVIMLSPFTPHFCDELWEEMGNKGMIFSESWPIHNEELTIADEISIAVQVNGKLRGTLEVERTISKDEVQEKALDIENVKKFIEGKTVVKVIVVPGKIVNIVIK